MIRLGPLVAALLVAAAASGCLGPSADDAKEAGKPRTSEPGSLAEPCPVLTAEERAAATQETRQATGGADHAHRVETVGVSGGGGGNVRNTFEAPCGTFHIRVEATWDEDTSAPDRWSMRLADCSASAGVEGPGPPLVLEVAQEQLVERKDRTCRVELAGAPTGPVTAWIVRDLWWEATLTVLVPAEAAS